MNKIGGSIYVYHYKCNYVTDRGKNNVNGEGGMIITKIRRFPEKKVYEYILEQ